MAYRYQPPPPYNPGPNPPDNSEKRDFVGLMTPKSVVQLAIWILMFGLGVGVAGLLLFIAYQSQINSLEGRIIDSQRELEKRLDKKLGDIDELESVPQASAPLSVSASSGRVRAEMIRNVGPSIVGIQGSDGGGQPTNGSGFVVNSTDGGSWVITNYSLVSGSRPDFNSVSVRMGGSSLIGQVYEVDPGSDLALITSNVPASRSLRFTRGELKEGDTVWAFGYARGKPYVAAVEGKLVDYSPARITIDVDPGVQFNGGPVIDSTGRVLGILSSAAIRSSGRAQASPVAGNSRSVIPISQVCNVVLRCPQASKAEASPGPSPRAAKPKPLPSPSPVPTEVPANAVPDVPLPPDSQPIP